jgi:hypothetical protein
MKSCDARGPAKGRGVMRCKCLRAACGALLLALCCCGALKSAAAQAAKDDQQSCQDFVQKFYDWYWNPFAEQADMAGLHGHTVGEVLQLKPPVLGPELLKLLKRETRGGGVESLDFDPFLNSNAPHGKYMVSKVAVSGDWCRATIDAGHEIAALKKLGASWVFVDFHYSYYYEDGTKRNIPDADLILLLTS